MFQMPFIGHQKNWELLLKDAAQNRLPPAYLFYGAPGIGKKKAALALVCRLFGREAGENTHPDLQFIQPDGNTIKIEAIRACQERLKLAPLEAPLKVVLIDEADSLTRQAANSLLKILEEPPHSTLFILITSSLFRILPTIRSRCRRLFFSTPPVEEMAETLAVSLNWPREKIREMLQYVDGSAGLMCELAGSEMAGAIENSGRLLTNASRSFTDIVQWGDELAKNREINMNLLLEVLKKRLFREMAVENKLSDLAKIDRISQAQRDLDGNVNKALVLENLMMEL
ncbi:MAG: DNA polymerase III subunit delta' [Deltaproteobacteria bacterium]|nr:DNA polymerase III subunit delta' [Deltaproteobacteria bacterium]